jgi:hypothetical protein
MLQVRCPVGALISPGRLWIYRDRFTSSSEESVERLGEFDIDGLLPFQPVPADLRAAAVAFETAVQDWLESLPSANTRELFKDAKLRSAIDHYIVPAIENGIVGAAGA